MQTQNYELSSIIYGTDEYNMHLDAVGASEQVKKNFRWAAYYLLSGRRMPENILNFLESKEYIETHHACDVASGEWINILKKHAKEYMLSNNLIEEKNWECYANNKHIQCPIEYYKTDKVFCAYDISLKKTIKVKLETIEKYLASKK